MAKQRKPWFRGAVSLAVLVGVAAALIASPAISLTSQEKRQVKKIVKKQINKLAPGLDVATAKKLANVTVQSEEFTVADNSGNGGSATCPAGQQALAGGVVSGANDTYVTHSGPSQGASVTLADGATFNGWFGFVFNQPASSGSHPMTVYVVCAG
jgi:hypothetical protein